MLLEKMSTGIQWTYTLPRLLGERNDSLLKQNGIFIQTQDSHQDKHMHSILPWIWLRGDTAASRTFAFSAGAATHICSCSDASRGQHCNISRKLVFKPLSLHFWTEKPRKPIPQDAGRPFSLERQAKSASQLSNWHVTETHPLCGAARAVPFSTDLLLSHHHLYQFVWAI